MEYVPIIAWFFSVITSLHPYPLLIGPHAAANECYAVREWLDARGYETASCACMPLPQDAILLMVGYLP